MNDEFDLIAVKYSKEQEGTPIRVEKKIGPKDHEGLAMFNPIGPGDVFELTLREGLDPMVFIKGLQFEGPAEPDYEVGDEYEGVLDWLHACDFEELSDSVVRFAVVKQGGNVWPILGLSSPDGLVPVLRSFEYPGSPSGRYLSYRCLVSYSLVSKGPGPVSWDWSGALLDLDEWWVETWGGDSMELSSDTLYRRPESLELGFAEWLHATPFVLKFVFEAVKCRWSNKVLSKAYGDAIQKVLDVSSELRMSYDLTHAECERIVSLLRSGSNRLAEFIRIVESENSPLASDIVATLENFGQHENPNFIANQDEVLEKLLGKPPVGA